jgi:hypothetical protein
MDKIVTGLQPFRGVQVKAECFRLKPSIDGKAQGHVQGKTPSRQMQVW